MWTDISISSDGKIAGTGVNVCPRGVLYSDSGAYISWGLGVLISWKYVRVVCFDPPLKMSRSFIQNCCWITLQVSHHQGWKTCQKWKAKLIFRGAWNSLMAWPDWPWPPYFTTDLLRGWATALTACYCCVYRSDTNCMLNSPADVAENITEYPGQRYTVDKQCQIIFGSESFYCAVSSLLEFRPITSCPPFYARRWRSTAARI